MPSRSQITEPHLVTRDTLSYLGIATAAIMQTLGSRADTLFPELFAWLAAQNIRPAGAPFIKHNVIDMNGGLETEITCTVIG